MDEPHAVEQVRDASGREEGCEDSADEDIDLVHRGAYKHRQGQHADLFDARVGGLKLGPHHHPLLFEARHLDQELAHAAQHHADSDAEDRFGQEPEAQ